MVEQTRRKHAVKKQSIMAKTGVLECGGAGAGSKFDIKVRNGTQ